MTSINTFAKTNEINVGYYIADYFSMKNDNGDYYGYAYDYLQEINSITKYKINIVEETYSELYQSLINPNDNSVQMMMGISECAFEDNNLIATTTPLTTTQYELYVKIDSKISFKDFDAMNGKRVGVFKGNKQKSNLEKYS